MKIETCYIVLTYEEAMLFEWYRHDGKPIQGLPFSRENIGVGLSPRIPCGALVTLYSRRGYEDSPDGIVLEIKARTKVNGILTCEDVEEAIQIIRTTIQG